MKPGFIFPILLILFTITSHAQEIDFSITAVAPKLLENANAVLRKDEVHIEVAAVDKLVQKRTRIVTVLNEYGNNHVEAGQFYNGYIKIKKQQAVIYNAAGEQIKKIKQKDFKDVSAISSNDLYTDSRFQYLDYTPQSYPYTVVYESEIQNSSTVFIVPWQPLSNYLISVENSSYHLSNPLDIPFRTEEKNMEGFMVQKQIGDYSVSYSVSGIPAYKNEYLSPPLEEFVPHLAIALNEFSLVGVKGKASNWKEFGKWQHDNLLAGKNQLPEKTVHKINALTAGTNTNVEKARLIYQYVQDNTRYISVQLGIGGWEPMPAAEVDKLGYGDCKALTNYTKALLDSQNIPSYYAVVYGGEYRRDLKEDFASMQGNHVILNIPLEGEDVWLECTSQTDPFNYLGDFTDNRSVLLLKPEGGEIVKTKAYSVSDNIIETFCLIDIDDSGNFHATVKRISEGVHYGNIYHLMRATEDRQNLYYKNSWGHLQNLKVSSPKFIDDRKNQAFKEELTLAGNNFVSKAGPGILMPLSFLAPQVYNIPRSSERRLPFEILRGATYRDIFIFRVPSNFDVESLPEGVNFETEFGKFQLEIELKDKEGRPFIEVIREFIIKEGRWSPEMYPAFRDFMIRVNTSSNQKAVLIATN